MKYLAKKIVKSTVNNDIIWPLIKPILKVGNFAYYSRRYPNDVGNVYSNLFKDPVVLNGPFKGMRYPSLDSVCSAIYPKLLGSYEKELHETLAFMKTRNYSEIIDVGCAEGYYAVGLGLMFPDAKVYAYDTDPEARKLCGKMVSLNNCGANVVIRETCTPQTLAEFNFTERGLIVCDCEGFEMQLFNQQNLHNLKKCDILIEVHDFINIEISGYLINLLQQTHDIKIIKSIDDYEKAKTYQFAETGNASLNEKLNLFREWRPNIQEWLICTPKS